ncbi:MAG: hypothetical protein HYR91_12460 [Flavobacteriia bacterium]|nr:hypothetical protein [Flavobacteriia bacterium]
MSKKINKKETIIINQLLEDIKSKNATKITTALKLLQVSGNISILKPLAEILLMDIPSTSFQEIIFFLGDLKVSSASDEMMDIIKDDKFLPIRQQLLTSIWNSKVDYSCYIADFVEIACEGNFMEALECLTIIENLEGPFEEQYILESQLHLKEYIEDDAPKDPQKAHILSEIAVLIKDFDLEIED